MTWVIPLRRKVQPSLSSVGSAFSRAIGTDVVAAAIHCQLQRPTLAIGPGREAERDIAAAGSQIEDLDRAAAGDVIEQSWQVTQHGRDAAGQTIHRGRVTVDTAPAMAGRCFPDTPW